MPPMNTDPQMRALLEAILPHVAFDGWGPAAFAAAVAATGMSPDAARAMCPRGAVDLAVLFHRLGDADMIAAVQAADLSEMRFRDKVAFALRARIAAIDDKEAVRRATSLFALPHLAGEGARLIWGTADAIWTVLGDTSTDINWYSKRATLSAVYASVILYWLGDSSADAVDTQAFIDRRIDDVMQVEKVKAQMRGNPLFKPLARLGSMVRAPGALPRSDLPGYRGPRG